MSVIETPDLPVDVMTGKRVESPEEATTTQRSKSWQKKDELVEYLMYGVLNPRWFTGEMDINEDSLILVSEFSQGTKKDIDFLGEALKYAREYGQSADIIYASLAILSASPKEYAKEKFLAIFNDVIRLNTLPGRATEDVSAFLQIIKANIFRGFGSLIRRALRGWIDATLTSENALHLYASLRATDYHNDNHVDSFIYRDIIRLSHYKAKTDTQQFLVRFLLGSRRVTTSGTTNTTIKNFIKYRGIRDEEVRKAFLKDKEIPFHLATRNHAHTGVWQEAFKHADIIDMVMNLNNLCKFKVFEHNGNEDHFVATLTDKKIIKRYPMLTPFHFMKLYDAYIGSEEKVLGALQEAIEISYVNLPKTETTAAVVLDNSSNMSAMGISYSRSLNAKRVINSIGAILYKYIPSCYIVPFAEKAIESSARKTLKTSEIADIIGDEDVGKNQDPRSAFKLLLEQNVDVDVVIAITKGKDWREFEFGNELTQYFMDVNHDAKVFFWNLSEYNNRSNTADLPNMVFLDGPDYRVIRYILDFIAPKKNIRQHIDNKLKQS